MDLLEAQISSKGTIECNFKDVADQVTKMLEEYKGIIVTEDTLKISKKDIAELRKIKTSIEDARKEVKKKWMLPYTDFEAKCKGLTGQVDECIDELNSQVKVFEDKQATEKRNIIIQLYNETIGEYSEFLPLPLIFKDSWLNKSTKEKDIVYDMSEKKTKIISELTVIRSLNSEIEDELLDVYKRTGNNLAAAVERNSQYISDKAKIEAAKTEAKENEIKLSTKDMELAKELKLNPENTGLLNEVVNKMKTVTFIVSAEDAQKVENMLSFEEISFRRLED